jgi:hypothetical protein
MRTPAELLFTEAPEDRLTRWRNDEAWRSFGYGGITNGSGTKTIKVYAGRVRIGPNAYIDVAEDDVSLSTDPEFVALRYDFANKTAAWVAGGTTDPVSDNTYFYESYFKLEQDSDGNYHLSKPGRLRFGDMVIPGAFGDG